ncbi:MAG: tetratricopeptide repeat protein [Deltaproteobacteria bacterium]|nr:tetratricopeptide repeat protein [Deltaproteobacteria bacterium]
MNRNIVFSGLGALALLAACATQSKAPPTKPTALVTSPTPRATSPKVALAPVNEAFDRGDYEAAQKGYASILKREPSNTDALFNLGVTLQRLGKLEEAKATYEQLISANPNDISAFTNLAVVLRRQGAIDAAIEVTQRGLALDAYNAPLLNNLAAFYRQKKSFDAAIDALRKLLMRHQDDLDAYKNLALVYADQKKVKLAQTILENALRMAQASKREDPDLFVNLGMVFLAQSETGRAMAAFKKAVAIEPNHLEANNNMGALALSHRDYALAARCFEIVARARPESYEAASALGYAYQGLQQLEPAARSLERARNLKLKTAVARAEVSVDDEAELLLQLTIIYQNANEPDKALESGKAYMALKNVSCSEEDFEGFCGRMNGVRLMKTMENQPPPTPQETAQKGGRQEIFTDGPEGVETGTGTGDGAEPTDDGEQP